MQHQRSEFKPNNPGMKYDWQGIILRSANRHLQHLRTETDPMLISMYRKKYFSALRDWHVSGEKGALI